MYPEKFFDVYLYEQMFFEIFVGDLFKLRFTNKPVREKYKMNMIDYPWV